MSSLGLNEHHQATVVNYMRFARYQRGQRIRAVSACFEDLKDSRLIESTFTVDEVSDMLDGLLSVLNGEVESELINTAHTNVLLLRQLFQQAEKWHLKMQADISELENRELLEQIKEFEEQEFAGAKRDSDKMSSSRLQPLNESGASALLNMEIERIKEDNQKLKDRLKQAESQVISSQQERRAMQNELDKTRAELKNSSGRKGGDSSEEVDALRRQLRDLKMEMDMSKSSKRPSNDGELAGAKHELLRIQEMLEMAEKELEKKVSQTAPFKNLKQMIQKKNEQIKDLRRRLSRYESPDD